MTLTRLWPHKVGFWRTLACLLFHRQSQRTDGMHRWRVQCECGREWIRVE